MPSSACKKQTYLIMSLPISKITVAGCSVPAQCRLSCFSSSFSSSRKVLFFFNETATTKIYTLSLHDALPILVVAGNEAAYRDQRAQQEAGLAVLLSLATTIDPDHPIPGISYTLPLQARA